MLFPGYFFFDSRTSGLICVLGMWYCGLKGIKEKSPFTKRCAEGDLDSTLVQFGIHAKVLAPTVRIQPLGTRICHRNGLSFARRSGRSRSGTFPGSFQLDSAWQCHVYVTWGKTSCKLCSTFLVWGLSIPMSWHLYARAYWDRARGSHRGLESNSSEIGCLFDGVGFPMVWGTTSGNTNVHSMYYNYNCWDQRHHRGLVVGKLLWQMLLLHFLDLMTQSC